MMNLFLAAIFLSFSVLVVQAETKSYTYTGNIVNAKCSYAAEIVSRNSRGYSPDGVSSFVPSTHKTIDTAGKRKTILRHCSINAGVTQFAFLDDTGNFFLLDEPGNTQVALKQLPLSKETAVTVKGSVDRSTLQVESLTVNR